MTRDKTRDTLFGNAAIHVVYDDSRPLPDSALLSITLRAWYVASSAGLTSRSPLGCTRKILTLGAPFFTMGGTSSPDLFLFADRLPFLEGPAVLSHSLAHSMYNSHGAAAFCELGGSKLGRVEWSHCCRVPVRTFLLLTVLRWLCTIMKITVCTRIGRGNRAGLGSRAGRSRYLRHTVDHVAPGGSCVGDGRWLRVYCYWIPAMAARKLPLALLNLLFAPHSRSIYRSIRLENPNTTH